MGLNFWDFERGPRFVASICSERQLHACMRMRVGSQVLTDPKVQRAMATLLGNTSVNAYGHRCAWPVPFRTASIPRSPRRLAIVRAEQSKQKVVAVLYKAGKAAENKDLLGCVENELGLREFLEEQVGHCVSRKPLQHIYGRFLLVECTTCPSLSAGSRVHRHR